MGGSVGKSGGIRRQCVVRRRSTRLRFSRYARVDTRCDIRIRVRFCVKHFSLSLHRPSVRCGVLCHPGACVRAAGCVSPDNARPSCEGTSRDSAHFSRKHPPPPPPSLLRTSVSSSRRKAGGVERARFDRSNDPAATAIACVRCFGRARVCVARTSYPRFVCRNSASPSSSSSSPGRRSSARKTEGGLATLSRSRRVSSLPPFPPPSRRRRVLAIHSGDPATGPSASPLWPLSACPLSPTSATAKREVHAAAAVRRVQRGRRICLRV